MVSDTFGLLLLPGISLPLRRSSLRAAYQSTFETVLRETRPTDTTNLSRLDVAVILNDPYPIGRSRASLFQHTQLILEELYTLTCVTASRNGVELDFPGGVDVRLFFLELGTDHLDPRIAGKEFLSGPLVDGLTFINAHRAYNQIYVPDCEIGERALALLTTLWRRQLDSVPSVRKVPCGIDTTLPDSGVKTELESNHKEAHARVIVGGTFDHLHIGHKLLLTALVFICEPNDSEDSTQRREITVGITGDELLVNKKHASLVESWDERQQKTAEFIESILVFNNDISSIRSVEHIDNPGPNGKIVKLSYGKNLVINYTRISDPFGPTITDESITALVVSKETRAGGKAVNDKRIEKGWAPLEIFEVDVLDASGADDEEDTKTDKTSFESKISSTEIRRRLEEKTANL